MKTLVLVDSTKDISNLDNFILNITKEENHIIIGDMSGLLLNKDCLSSVVQNLLIINNFDISYVRKDYDVVFNFNVNLDNNHKNKKGKNTPVFTIIYKIEKRNNFDLLKGSLESLFNQTINFDKNVEMVICDPNYQKELDEICDMHPNIYYHYLNCDSSNPQYINGKYVTVMSENDKLQINTLESIYEFGELHKEIDVFSVKTKYFGQYKCDKFNEFQFFNNYTFISNIEKEYWNIPISTKGLFFRANKFMRFSNILEVSNELKNNPYIALISPEKALYYEYATFKELYSEYTFYSTFQLFENEITISEKFQIMFLEKVAKMHNPEIDIFDEDIFKNWQFQKMLYFSLYKISIIMPVYNVEEYLHAAVQSILNQSIDMNDIQLILINDGSTDSTEEICLEYQKKHPNNILYIRTENGGVAKARNLGLDHAKGEIINFLDSDDKLGLSTIENVYKFMQKNPQIDISAVRIALFGASKGGHPLNYKFDHKISRVSDLTVEYWNVQLSASTSFIRRSAIGDLRFDNQLKYGEDAAFIHSICVKNPKIGLISYTDGCYWYRKRVDKSSAMQNTTTSKEWYLDTVNYFHSKVLNDSNALFSQFTVMYDLQWRLKVNPYLQNVLKDEEKNSYKEIIYSLLKNIEDSIIMDRHFRAINPQYKGALLSIKYGSGYNLEDSKIINNDIPIMNVKDLKINMAVLEIKNGILHLVFRLPSFEKGKLSIEVKYGDSVVLPDNTTFLNESYLLERELIGEQILEYYIPLYKKDADLKIEVVIDDKVCFPAKIIQGKFSRLANTKIPHLLSNRYFVEFDKKSTFKILYNSKIGKRKTRQRLIKMLKKKKHRKIGIYRLVYSLLKKFSSKNIWLVSDRIDHANDNGEAFYKWLLENPLKNVKPYFIIDKDSPDFKRLKNQGYKLVPFKSKKYNLLMLLADKLILSHVDDIMLKPFGKKYEFYKDLLSFDLIFMQHGIIYNDISNWLNKANKNIRLFVTSGIPEFNSIINKYPYGYSEKNVRLTGLSRYDLLVNSPKDYITIMPTWRPRLVREEQRNNFLDSQYFEFYNGLIYNDSLMSFLKDKGYKLKFVQHPNMRKKFNSFFESNDVVEIVNNTEYKTIISESRMLITDLSSLFFDFAYLNKPILYTHFDFDDLISQSTYKKGYLDFERDGFGEVVMTVEETVEEIIKIINNNFALSRKYQDNVDAFFKFRDQSNRKRIMEEILNIDN
ncbi:glycosyltransferase [Neobacillus mesonae]|uniref:bifunctional glycosyltransferase/CDP-glycerol:glycerophosphate glycerophosphotransferase n=1 Tax=Neobacillus mesonae TaxID=1193713 RepID=UPI002E218382|nr:CDP-glycerol glycerophosphotransferase family protein [Neobacillus mesonae]